MTEFKDLTDRDIDAMIAKEILGWKLADVPPDINGENACKILTPNGVLDDIKPLLLPAIGNLHEGYWCQRLADATGFWEDLLALVKRVELNIPAYQLPHNKRDIAILCIKKHRKNKRLGIVR